MHFKPLLCLENLYFQSYPAEIGQNLKDPGLFIQTSAPDESTQLGSKSLFKMWVTSRDSCISSLSCVNCIPKFSRFLQTDHNSLHNFCWDEFETNSFELHLHILASLWVSESLFRSQKLWLLINPCCNLHSIPSPTLERNLY